MKRAGVGLIIGGLILGLILGFAVDPSVVPGYDRSASDIWPFTSAWGVNWTFNWLLFLLPIFTGLLSGCVLYVGGSLSSGLRGCNCNGSGAPSNPVIAVPDSGIANPSKGDSPTPEAPVSKTPRVEPVVLTVPMNERVVSHPGMWDCPACNGVIYRNATTCRHCGSTLNLQ